MSGAAEPITAERLMREVRARHPRLGEALVADASVTAAHRGERAEFRSRADAALQILRLMWSSDAFLAQALYRAKARLQALGVPVLPRICHRFAIMIAQVAIGDPVVVQPGLYLLHGQVVIDGLTEIGPRARIAPFVTIGLLKGDFLGPRLGHDVEIGTGAKVVGQITLGSGAQIGANAVVIDDVAEGATVVGVPATPRQGQQVAPPEVAIAVRLMHAFAEVEPEARFVQIGANDGARLDPLAPFVRDLPWRGVMVEPVPYVFERLRALHNGNPRVALENAAITATGGDLPFYGLAESPDPAAEGLPEWYDAVGSFDREVLLSHADQIPDLERRVRTLDVPCMTFESLLTKHEMSDIDLLLIDVEGYDGELLRTLDLDRHHPRLIIYEHVHLDSEDRAECEAMLTAGGYELIDVGPDTWCLDTSPADRLTEQWRVESEIPSS